MRHVFALCLALAILFPSAASWANGGFYAKSIPRMALPQVEIPLQRAMIVHRDGVQTLLIESTARTESAEVGWVLPLPAEPTALAEAQPGLLLTLDLATSPMVSESTPLLPVALSFLGVGLLLLWLAHGRRKADKQPFLPSRLLELLLALLLMVFLASIMLPSLGGSGGPGTGVAVLSSQRVGLYEVSVLKASDPADLEQWLADAGLAGPDPAGRAILADYIAEDWCFVVARLAVEPGADATPHPIRVTFPTPEPIYPMRLTAIGGSTTRVQLFVVAERQASAPGFTRIASDRLHRRNDAEWRGEPHFDDWRRPTLRLAHPDMNDYLWFDCVLTRLEADLSPAQMDRDIRLALGTLTGPHRLQLYNRTGRWHWLLAIAGIGLGSVLCVAAVWIDGGKTITRPRRNLLLALALLTLPAMAVRWATLDVHTEPAVSWFAAHSAGSGLNRQARGLIRVGVLHAGLAEQDPQDYPQQVRELIEGPNPFTGQPIRRERSPGNYMIVQEDGRTWFCTYAMDGREDRLELPPAPQVANQSEPIVSDRGE